VRMRFCPDCEEGVAYGQAKRCAACRLRRRRARALALYHARAERINAERRGRQRAPTPAQRERQNVLKRAYERAATQADVDTLLAAWGERPRQMRRSRSVA
jgi:hypothetical protein